MTTPYSRQFNKVSQQIDARGWLCPQPVIHVRQWLEQAEAGERVHIVITDPHGPLDFEVFCARTGHRLLACESNTVTDSPQWDILIECA